MNILFEDLSGFLLVFVRMSGMFLTNPLFSRNNIPAMSRMGLVLVVTILVNPLVETSHLAQFSEIDFVLSIFFEALLGLICGFVFQIFYYLLHFAGDFMDMQFGMSMAKIYDPASSIQMSISGTFLTVFFFLYIFATDSHLLLIRIFTSSYDIIPVGVRTVNPGVGKFVYELFADGMLLIVKLVMPFLVAEMILEVGMGILMKIIPQIHVFVINIQFKMLLGMTLLLLFAVPISRFMGNYINFIFEGVVQALKVAAQVS